MPKYAELQAFRKQNFITKADGDMLHREARVLAIRRIEENARTESDALLSLWIGVQMKCIFPASHPMMWFKGSSCL